MDDLIPTKPLNQTYFDLINSGQIVIQNTIIDLPLDYDKAMRAEVDDLVKKMIYKKWKDRKAVKPEKDCKVGVIAEQALNHYLIIQQGFPSAKVNTTAHAIEDKNWDSDLFYLIGDGVAINVKTSTLNTRKICGGFDSWTFQYNEKVEWDRDALFKRPDSTELIFFMYVPNEDIPQYKIIASAPWNLICPLLKEPVLDYLKPYKKCLYMEDLMNIVDSLSMVI